MNMLKEVVYCYIRNAVLFHAYELRTFLQSSRRAECISRLRPGFQCGVNVLVHFSITLQPVFTKGRDTNDGMIPNTHATLGLAFLKSDGANDTSEKSSGDLWDSL